MYFTEFSSDFTEFNLLEPGRTVLLVFFHDISGSLWDLAEFYWVLVDFTGFSGFFRFY